MTEEIQKLAYHLPADGELELATSDDLRSTFLQNVSHELRTPLALMRGYAELLRDEGLGPLAPQQKQAIRSIVDRVHDMRTLVERISVLLATHARASVWLPFTLPEIVEEAVEAIRATAVEQEPCLDIEIEPNLPLASGDPYQLKTAIDCLLDAALKFTADDQAVRVHAYAEPEWLCLTVTGNGISLPEQETDHSYAQLLHDDGSTNSRYNELSLALAVVTAVIEGHSGQIEVASQAGQGSRFTVKLPAMPSPTPEEQPVLSDVVPRRILVVDDEENVAKMLQRALGSLPNCEVGAATSGEEALEQFAQAPFELLITDYKMPGTDGMTLAARVRQLYPRTAIIMITAYNNHVLRKLATRVDVRRILDKPVQLEVIRSVALEALEEDPPVESN
jgi:CheY-like chemotaxis protein